MADFKETLRNTCLFRSLTGPEERLFKASELYSPGVPLFVTFETSRLPFPSLWELEVLGLMVKLGMKTDSDESEHSGGRPMLQEIDRLTWYAQRVEDGGGVSKEEAMPSRFVSIPIPSRVGYEPAQAVGAGIYATANGAPSGGRGKVFEVKLPNPTEGDVGAEVEGQPNRPLFAGMQFAPTLRGDWFVTAVVPGSAAQKAGVVPMARLVLIKPDRAGGKTDGRKFGDQSTLSLVDEHKSLIKMAKKGELRGLAVTLQLITLEVFVDAPNGQTGVANGAAADETTTEGAGRFRPGDVVEVDSNADGTYVMAKVMKEHPPPHNNEYQASLLTDEGEPSGGTVHVRASAIRWKREPWASTDKVREAAITLLRSLALFAAKPPGDDFQAVLVKLRRIAFLPVSEKGMPLQLCRARKLCLPSQIDLCFTQKNTMAIDVVDEVKKDGLNLDQLFESLGVEKELSDEVFEQHVIEVGKSVMAAVGSSKQPIRSEKFLKLKAFALKKGREITRGTSAGSDADAPPSPTGAPTDAETSSFPSTPTKGEEAWGDYLKLSGLKGTGSDDPLVGRRLTKKDVLNAYVEAGSRKWGSEGHLHLHNISRELHDVNCVWVSDKLEKRNLALKPSQLYLHIDKYQTFAKKSHAFSDYGSVGDSILEPHAYKLPSEFVAAAGRDSPDQNAYEQFVQDLGVKDVPDINDLKYIVHSTIKDVQEQKQRLNTAMIDKILLRKLTFALGLLRVQFDLAWEKYTEDRHSHKKEIAASARLPENLDLNNFYNYRCAVVV